MAGAPEPMGEQIGLGSERGRAEERHRGCNALQAIVRILAFTLSKVRSYWRVLSGGRIWFYLTRSFCCSVEPKPCPQCWGR